MLHWCNIWCTESIGENPVTVRVYSPFLLIFPELKKNNLAENVTFFDWKQIAFLTSPVFRGWHRIFPFGKVKIYYTIFINISQVKL